VSPAEPAGGGTPPPGGGAPPPVILSARGVTLPPSFKALVQAKLARLTRVPPQVLDARVVCSAEKFRRTVRVTLRTRQRTFASEATAGDLTTALDEALEAVRRQSREAKERRTVSKGRAARRAGGTVAAPSPAGSIVPRRLVAKPMSVEEATMQLAAGREQFFVFRNAESGEVNVLYRRRDGGLGLIEPVA
jgi:putative sigma-54 modulation protein